MEKSIVYKNTYVSLMKQLYLSNVRLRNEMNGYAKCPVAKLVVSHSCDKIKAKMLAEIKSRRG